MKIKYSYLQNEEQENVEQQQPTILVCPQYVVLTPFDTSGWSTLKQQLSEFANDRYDRDRLLDYIQQRYRNKGYRNIRLLRKIRTEYFWSSALSHVVTCVVKDSSLLSCQIPVLCQQQNITLKLTKYQIFLILGHMLLGTFPDQLYNGDVSLGHFMTVYDDEDQVSSKEVLFYRLNKIKNIAKYMCVFKRKSEEDGEMANQVVIFQRSYLQEDPNKLLSNVERFCQVQPKIGQYYEHNNPTNKTCIISTSPIHNGKLTASPTPGQNCGNSHDLHVEERIFFSHPELFVLPALLSDGLGQGETVVVHGVEKYADLFAVSKHEEYDFRSKVVDESKINNLYNCRSTSYAFVPRLPYNHKTQYDIIPDIMALCSALKASKTIRCQNQPLISGKVTPIILPQSHSRSLKPQLLSPHKIQLPWDLQFLVDWLSASVMGFHKLQFYVDDVVEQTDVKILVKEMRDYCVADVVSVLGDYWGFRDGDGGKLGFMEFMKDFVL